MKGPYSKVRIGFVSILFAAAFVLFFARLVYVQVIRGAEFRERARRQYLESIELPACRGEIIDVKGTRVVVNGSFASLFAYPLSQDDVTRAYGVLARVFKCREAVLRKKYPLATKKFRWIKRGLTADELARFQTGDTRCGLFIREEPTREYPFGEIGHSILGFVDLDNRGRSGVELVMNDYLAGTPGRSLIQKNGIGDEYQIREIPLKGAAPGASVVLTVDWDKQQIVEEELARAVDKFRAKGGTAIFLDPWTGAVLAAADCIAGPSDDKPMKLNAVAGIFEPGSIWKLITAAAALEDGGVRPGDRFYAEKGCWRLGRHLLRDDHEYDTITFRDAFEKSSNIVMGKIANQIGADRVFAMAQKFGFGRKARCGLNGESRGILKRPRRWSQYTTAAFAIGHGVSVTPLQMAQAFAVIAAGGYLTQPHFIAGCITDDRRIVERHTSRPVKILDEDAVAVLDSFLRGVVERGTATPVGDAPFLIAGKTATAEKPNLESGGYFKSRFMASFAGYFPADSPLVAGIVVLDEPEPIHYGGYTAGPTFKNIAVKFAALDDYAVPAPVVPPPGEADGCAVANMGENEWVRVPDLDGSSRGRAAYELRKRGLRATFAGSGDRVVGTRPAADSRVSAGQEVHCYLMAEETAANPAPDLIGLTIREAIALLDKYGIAFSCRGKGKVVRQTPPAGTELAVDDVIQFECERHKGV